MGEEIYYIRNNHTPMRDIRQNGSALFFSTLKKEPQFEKLPPDSRGKKV